MIGLKSLHLFFVLFLSLFHPCLLKLLSLADQALHLFLQTSLSPFFILDLLEDNLRLRPFNFVEIVGDLMFLLLGLDRSYGIDS